MSKSNFFAFAVLFVSLSTGSPSRADTPFYKGKSITTVADTKAGDVYDLYAWLFAQYMPKYIPGNPDMIVQNMPGADSVIAVNYVHNVAHQDGLTIGAIPPGRYTVKATYEDETKQIKNLQIAEDHRVTRLIHWDLKEES